MKMDARKTTSEFRHCVATRNPVNATFFLDLCQLVLSAATGFAMKGLGELCGAR
jgi:hypothetical protein